MEIMEKFRNGGGASLLGRCSKGFENARRGICLFDDALTFGSAMVSKTYFPSGLYGVGEKNSKCCVGIRHPEAKPKDLKRFFASAQNDMDISRLGILAAYLPNKRFFVKPGMTKKLHLPWRKY